MFIDGLRTIAALWVLVGHIRLFTLGWDGFRQPWGWPLNLPLYMNLAVNLFLVLSGFCLARAYLAHGQRLRGGLAGFLRARARRILPPYFGALGLILLVNAVLPLAQWGRHPAGLTLDLAPQVLWTNLLLLQDILPQYNVLNTPFWSVACEWHLYFLFPLLAWLLRKGGRHLVLLLGAALAAGMTWASLAQGPLSVAGEALFVPRPPHYVFLFCAGIWAAAALQGRWPVRWPALALAALWLALAWQWPIMDGVSMAARAARDHWHDTVAGAAFALLLVGLARLAPGHALRRWLERPWLVRTAGYSYSLYLVHVPLLAVLYHLARGHSVKSFLVYLVLGVPLCLAAARRFAAVFERPAVAARPKRMSPGHTVGPGPTVCPGRGL